MKRSPLMAAASVALLMTSPLVVSQNYAQDAIQQMPEVKVTGDVESRPHPQDKGFSERPLGCVEVVTPSGTGNELGGYHQARFGRSSYSVMPSLSDPSSANESRSWREIKEYQAIPPGTASTVVRCPEVATPPAPK
jgi:hypothetical protein